MNDRYAIGIDGQRTLVVNVRDGAVALHADAQDVNALPDDLLAANVAPDAVIAVGITGPGDAPESPRLKAWASFNSALVRHVPRDQAHVPGCGVAAPSTLVMILDDPSIFLLNSRTDATIDGVERISEGFLPEYTGYRFTRPAPDPNERSAIESSAFELRRTIQSIRSAGVQVRRFMACGTLSKIPAVLQIYADVLDGRIKLPVSEEPAALGAAIFAALATGPAITRHATISQLVHAMARQRKDLIYRPDLRARRAYDRMFRELDGSL